MQIPSIPYMPLPAGASIVPLERFIPPYSSGLITRWLENKIQPGAWLIDPMGANPLLDLEAARNGYNILVARSNPVIRLMLEVMASAPKEEEFRSTLTPLLMSPIGDEHLEQYLQSLYLTHCSNCNAEIMVKGYIWERDQQQPLARLYSCHHCGDEGEHPIIQFDLDLLAELNKQENKHRARARQRVAMGLEHGFSGLEGALKCYNTRALIFIMSLINKLEGLGLAREKQNLVMALLLSLMDYGNNLWPWPLKAYHPLTLTIPGQYFEHNLNLVLQDAIRHWSNTNTSVPLTRWPEVPVKPGGICMYLRNKLNPNEIKSSTQPNAAVTLFSHPNQAFLTLSALWSGWLWGSQVIRHVHSALERRRYDWHWFAGALQQILRPIQRYLPESASFFALAPDPTPANLFAILASAKSSGFELQGLALRQDDQLFQIEWKKQTKITPAIIEPSGPAFRKAIETLIRERGEPTSYEDIQYICMITHALDSELPTSLHALREDELNPLLIEIRKIFEDAFFLKSFKTIHVPQSTQWWLANARQLDQPLADRVEKKVVEILQQGETITLSSLDQEICKQFSGLLTPPLELVKEILESYTQPFSEVSSIYQLRSEDESKSRFEDQEQVINILKDIAVRLAITVTGENPLLWLDKNGEPLYKFFILETGILSPIIETLQEIPPEKCIIVIPASRSHLIQYKLRRDLHLKDEIDQGWKFLKLRYLRKLAQRENLTLALWEELLDGDPPLWDEPKQLKIL